LTCQRDILPPSSGILVVRVDVAVVGKKECVDYVGRLEEILASKSCRSGKTGKQLYETIAGWEF
jgi:hypothetical protein